MDLVLTIPYLSLATVLFGLAWTLYRFKYPRALSFLSVSSALPVLIIPFARSWWGSEGFDSVFWYSTIGAPLVAAVLTVILALWTPSHFGERSNG